MSEAQEIAIGRESDAQVRAEMGVYDDPELREVRQRHRPALAKLSERPNLPWQFAVVDQPAINAFALPGGFIYVTRGILPFLDNEAELAGVLGHEIGHVTARHSVRQYTRTIGGVAALGALGVFVPAARPFGQISEQALGLLFLKYGRDDELQADQLGARYEATGGWDPAGVPGMLTTLGRLDEAAGDRKGSAELALHASRAAGARRGDRADGDEAQGRADSNFVTNRDGARARLDGVIFGDNPEQGVTRGSTFLHPPLRFRIDFPPKWEVANSPQQVVAKAPDADVFMLLQGVTQAAGTDGPRRGVATCRRPASAGARASAPRSTGSTRSSASYEGQIEGLGEVAQPRRAHRARRRVLHGGRPRGAGRFRASRRRLHRPRSDRFVR